MEMSTFFTLNCRGRLVSLSAPLVMGILNVTPDSFSDGGRYFSESAALHRTEEMLKQGAAIIDIGAQSTRPGAERLSAQDEIARLGKLISSLKKKFPEALLSLDTFYGEAVRFGYDEGIDLINDISGGSYDPEMWPAVVESKLPYVLMHSNPTYDSMHQTDKNQNSTVEINRYFSEKILRLREAGVTDIILDPGFGFGKTVAQQINLIENAEVLGFDSLPLLAGISRKSFVYKTLGKTPAGINSEVQHLHLKLLQKGVKILRVHDVAETVATIKEFISA